MVLKSPGTGHRFERRISRFGAVRFFTEALNEVGHALQAFAGVRLIAWWLFAGLFSRF